jgi:D-glycero-D-manno-heptose 1,7-bisphosphate phosphatase
MYVNLVVSKNGVILIHKAVFLDRDGVINEYITPVNTYKDLHLIKGVPEAIKLLNDNKYKVFIVTNQGGIGLGFMKEDSLIKIHEQMKKEILLSTGGRVEDIMYCPHKPKEGCKCRKPEAKMIVDLAKKHNITLKESYMIGDRVTDIKAGKSAGTKTIFIGESINDADASFPNLLEAVKWILA